MKTSKEKSQHIAQRTEADKTRAKRKEAAQKIGLKMIATTKNAWADPERRARRLKGITRPSVRPRSIEPLLQPSEQREILRQHSDGDFESSRETVEQICSIASLLDVGSDHGNNDLGGQAAQGLAQLLRAAAVHIEREYKRLYWASGVRYEPSESDA